MLVKSLQLIYNVHAERPIQAELQLFIFVLRYLKWCVVWEERKIHSRVRAQHGALQFGSKWAIKKQTNAQASHRKPNSAQLSRDCFWTWFVSLSVLWVGFVEHVGNFVHWPKFIKKVPLFIQPTVRAVYYEI